MKNNIKTLYNPIPLKLFENYLDTLINRIFKILPLKEEKSQTVDVYIMNLLSELTGNYQLIAQIHNDSLYETVLANLQSLIGVQTNYRTIVLNTISVVEQIKTKYCKKE
ncbi:MAG: hypothetical protein NC244_07760 [Alistipes senegalensis]|nr:hypothetical protein [Alistipes senegalensis]